MKAKATRSSKCRKLIKRHCFTSQKNRSLSDSRSNSLRIASCGLCLLQLTRAMSDFFRRYEPAGMTHTECVQASRETLAMLLLVCRTYNYSRRTWLIFCKDLMPLLYQYVLGSPFPSLHEGLALWNGSPPNDISNYCPQTAR